MKTARLGIFVLILCFAARAVGQSMADTRLTLEVPHTTLDQLVAQLNGQIKGTIFCPPKYGALAVYATQQTDVLLSELLQSQLDGHELGVLFYRNSVALILSKSEIEKDHSASYYQALEESIEVSNLAAGHMTVIGSIEEMSASGNIQISGKVRDKESLEEVVGATLVLEVLQEGTATEPDGTYVLEMRSGTYMLVVQYVGYQVQRIPIQVISTGVLDIELERSAVLLDEVVVQAQAKDENVQSVQVGVTRLSTKEIEKLPSFLGEVDIIKGMLLQPGVNSIGEGSGGFNVRGGNVDQNLILIDEGLIFNASHALGFFSSFNSDIVSDATLYKGTMPATYGGRLASALTVNVRDGSFDRWHAKGGLGVVSSRINIDGPIKKGKTALLLSARSTYSDWLLKNINNPEVKGSSFFFYDLNFRLSHRFNEKNSLILSAYRTDDDFSFNNRFGFDYGTTMGQMQYRKLLGAQGISTTSLVWSTYRSGQEDLEGVDVSLYQTGLQYFKFKENVHFVGDQIQGNIGGSAIAYHVDGNRIEPTSDQSLVLAKQLEDEQGIEWSVYADLDYPFSPRLSLNGGVRYSIFQYLGPKSTYNYLDPSKPTTDGLLDPVVRTEHVIKSFGHLQPRLSMRYNLTASSSVKLGYGRTVQYINQIYNSETPTPTTFWQLSNQYIQPQLAHNFSLGYFRNFSDNIWVTSIEGFYRNIDQLFDFKGFANLLLSDHLETELLPGNGRAYGLELSINRQIGDLHGWLSYTYSKSERSVPGINNGQWYVSNFDKPHDLSLITNIQLNKRNSISINFSFGTGRPITVPESKHIVQGRVVVLNYSERNAYRIPDYHRLDLAYTLAQGFRKSKKFKTSWTLSLYNVYGRKNAYSVYVEQVSTGATKIRRLAVLGSIFPSITFNFELL